MNVVDDPTSVFCNVEDDCQNQIKHRCYENIFTKIEKKGHYQL